MPEVLHTKPGSPGLFITQLRPKTKKLTITRLDGVHSGTWVHDLTAQAEGSFQPLVLTKASGAALYVAGRLAGAAQRVIYQVDLTWNGSVPELAFTPVYLGAELGDATKIFDAVDYNGEIVVFDWTNARISYVEKSDGSIAHVATPAAYPHLANMLGMHVATLANEEGDVLEGLSFILQPNQYVLVLSEGIPTLVLDDRLGDGTIDESFTYQL